jgi:hypothetical protein
VWSWWFAVFVMPYFDLGIVRVGNDLSLATVTLHFVFCTRNL